MVTSGTLDAPTLASTALRTRLLKALPQQHIVTVDHGEFAAHGYAAAKSSHLAPHLVRGAIRHHAQIHSSTPRRASALAKFRKFVTTSPSDVVSCRIPSTWGL
jgi:hypothetical protein